MCEKISPLFGQAQYTADPFWMQQAFDPVSGTDNYTENSGLIEWSPRRANLKVEMDTVSGKPSSSCSTESETTHLIKWEANLHV